MLYVVSAKNRNRLVRTQAWIGMTSILVLLQAFASLKRTAGKLKLHDSKTHSTTTELRISEFLRYSIKIAKLPSAEQMASALQQRFTA